LHTFTDKRQHAARKRLLSHAFSESALKQAENFLLSTIRIWCAHLCPDDHKDAKNSHWSEKKDMGRWSNLLTLDVLGELCFGETFGGIEGGDNTVLHFVILSSKILQMVCKDRATMSSFMLITVQVAYLPCALIIWPIFKYPAILAAISEVGKSKAAYRLKMSELISQRHQLELKAEKDGTETRKDYFHYLFRGRDTETGAEIEPSEIVGEAALLVGAGSDTSSTAMAGCFFYLLRNPAALQALPLEIRNAFADVEEIRSGSKLSSLHWLRACIDEAMRMTPPVPGVLSRRVLPGGVTVDSSSFTAGTTVGVPIYAIHHNETYFPDPFSYLPERWIQGSHTPHCSMLPAKASR
jgi:cytochrome P450